MRSDLLFLRFVYMLALLLAMFILAFGQEPKIEFPYLNPKLSVDARVQDLLGRMSIAEKIAQLQCEIQEVDGRDSIITKGLGNLAISLRPLGPREAAEKANRLQKLAVEKTRSKIPIIIHDEALHGLIGKEATSFPQAIGLAATWNPALMKQIASVIGKQSRSRGIRQVLSPVINIARDVRWGRVEETYGEDPYLTARMGVAFCQGIEAEGVISTPKHFAANVGDGGRDKQINFDWGGGPPDSSIAPDRFSVRWTGTLIPTTTDIYKMSITTDDGVRLYIDGKLMVDSWVDRAPTTDYFTVQLEAERRYDLRIEYYENGGGAVASLGWNLETGVDKEMADAIATAKNAEAAIIVAGIIEGEGRDRADLNLPGSQEELIKAVTATGVPTAVVLMTGSAVTMHNWIDEVPAIVAAWYAGEEGGNAIAEVLFGDYNPGGKLPLTFPQNVGQVPLYYNVKPSGRGYDYVSLSGKPQFPFGHGLSYTQFEYTNLQITPKQISPTQSVQISIDVQNIGARAGDEVVQLYLRDVVASVARPLKELKGFKRITPQPQEKQTVTFVLTPEQLLFLDQSMKTVVEPGEFEVMVGSSSDDIRLRESFEVRAR